MDQRLDLHEFLCELLGSRNAYFQPPANVRMNYPAIVYTRKNIDNLHANNLVYKQDVAYELTVIDSNPNSEIVSKVSRLSKCRFDRHFAKDGLNHDTFTIYY